MKASGELLTKQAVQETPWKVWVAEFVAMQTAKKDNRELVSGYKVVHSGKEYEIIFAGQSVYGKMTAENLYNWMERLPLIYFSREADEIRAMLAQ